LERLRAPHKNAVSLYRLYHHMYGIGKENLYSIPGWWFEEYGRQGIDMTSIAKDRPYWWDYEVIEFFRKHGTKLFARDQIWDIDWQEVARVHGLPAEETAVLADPRNIVQKMIHRWLRQTQPHAESLIVKAFDYLLDKIL